MGKKGNTGIKHGMCSHPLYGVWRKIKDRLYNPNHESYHLYGGDGVTMCEEWKNSAPKFISWALGNGWKKGLQIDKDKIPYELGIPAKQYSPEFCSILTPKENNQYTKTATWYEFNGKRMILIDWAEELKIDYATLHHRIFLSNYSIEKAFTLPAGFGRNKKYECNGEMLTIGQIAKKTGMSRSTVECRLRRNWPMDKVINTPQRKR